MGMDKNNNRAVIYKLAKREQRANRTRNFYNGLTIALSTALVFAFILYLFGSQEEKLRELEGSTQVSYENIALSQAELLKQDSRIKWIGLEIYVGRGKVGNTRLSVFWQDERFMEKDRIAYVGKLPAGDNEIMVPQEYVEKNGNMQPGDTAALDLGDKVVRDYKIAAISTNPSKTQNSQHIYVSLPCAMKMKGGGEERVTASVNMEGAVDMSLKEAEEQAAVIAEKAGIEKEQVKVDTGFFMQSGLSRLTTGDVATLGLVVLLILVAAGIVVHSILYISVTGKVREYGQMRTIGMTKKQVKSLIFQEGIGLALKGSVFGLLPGGLMGYALAPGGFDVFNFLAAAIVCVFLSVLFVSISIRKPGEIAACASPVEALEYTGYTGERRQRLKSRLTPEHLAVLNLKRNRKKSAWTMCSMILAGVLLGTIATYVVSYDPAASVEISFPEGEYQLVLTEQGGFGGDISLDGKMKQQSLLQAEDFMGEELQTEIKRIEGVKKVKPWRYLAASTTLFDGEEHAIGINGISESDFELLKEMGYEGPDSYEELTKKPGLIITNDYQRQLQENPLSIGDEVPMAFYDKDGKKREVKLPVVAIVNYNSWADKNRTVRLPLSLLGSSFMMPNAVMDEWTGIDTIYGCEVAVESEKSKAVGEALEELYGLEENLYLASKAENRAFYEKEYFPTQIIMYTLAGFIMVFGIINLVNTILSNLYSRRKELGILQALGMTTGQLKRMIGRETLSYTGASALCTLIFGSGLGYALVMAQIQMGMNMVYAYPWLPVVLYLLAMFLIQWGFTDYGVKFLQKESFVERIKTL